MIAPGRRWEDLTAGFGWQVPEEFNFGALIDAWGTDRSRVALYWEDESGRRDRLTFWDVAQASNQAMNALAALGVGRRRSRSWSCCHACPPGTSRWSLA